MIITLNVLIVILLIAINRNLVLLRKENKDWLGVNLMELKKEHKKMLTEIAENVIFREDDNSPS